jgi:hypothetical protein
MTPPVGPTLEPDRARHGDGWSPSMWRSITGRHGIDAGALRPVRKLQPLSLQILKSSSPKC